MLVAKTGRMSNSNGGVALALVNGVRISPMSSASYRFHQRLGEPRTAGGLY
jgi:hypothetical protein